MSEWQPISTAPKDGTEILGWGVCEGDVFGDRGYAARGVIAWSERTNRWELRGVEYYPVWMTATHWMPLPPPPTED